MRKFVIITFSFLFLSFGILNAQDDQFRIISCSGEVSFMTQNDSTIVKVLPGDKINPNGILVMGKTAKVKFICNDHPHTFEGENEIDLTKIYEGSITQSMSFTGKFWKFIVDGLKKSDTKADLTEYHEAYLDVKGGIKGYSSESGIIQINYPYAGHLSEDFTLRWDSKLSQEKYTIKVLDESTRAVVFEKAVSGHLYKMNLIDLGLIENNAYYLQVSDIDDNKSEIKIYYQEIDEQKINRKLERVMDFEEASPKEQRWMRAIILEMEDNMTAAAKIYVELLEEYPHDGYIEKLYKLFLTRNGQLEKIEFN